MDYFSTNINISSIWGYKKDYPEENKENTNLCGPGNLHNKNHYGLIN